MKNTTRIYCTNPQPGQLTFYVETGRNTYYLFSQPYRSGVEKVFSKGLFLKEIMNNSKLHYYDACVSKTLEKLPVYLRYVEKEYGLELFRNSRKNKKNRLHFLSVKEESFFTEMEFFFGTEAEEHEREIA